MKQRWKSEGGGPPMHNPRKGEMSMTVPRQNCPDLVSPMKIEVCIPHLATLPASSALLFMPSPSVPMNHLISITYSFAMHWYQKTYIMINDGSPPSYLPADASKHFYSSTQNLYHSPVLTRSPLLSPCPVDRRPSSRQTNTTAPHCP